MPKQKIQIMEKDLFRNLPSEIKIEILSRLPIRSAIKCKLVDRSWRSMIESPEFANSYKSAPCLLDTIRFKAPTYSYKVYEVEDGDENSENSCKEAFNFSFPHDDAILHTTSVNGLLYMTHTYQWESHDMYICNPITREYITVPGPENVGWHDYSSYGFGVSRKSRQFKVFRVFIRPCSTEKDCWWTAGCQVYTLGTGLWRSFAITPPSSSSLANADYNTQVFLYGNVHWLVYDKLDYSQWISCFDLETELFNTLRTPRLGGIFDCSLHVVRDCLGICDCSFEDEIAIWLMKDYGDDKSWTKQFVIPTMGHDHFRLIHVFKDGDILLRYWCGIETLHYSNKTKSIKKAHLFQRYAYDCGTTPVSYTPSFVPLKGTFSSTENVSSF